MRRWYLMLTGVWLVLGLPGLILSFGSEAGPPWEAVPQLFRYAALDPVNAARLLAAWAGMLSPILLAPFGIRRKPQAD